jgi:hypothetical protein
VSTTSCAREVQRMTAAIARAREVDLVENQMGIGSDIGAAAAVDGRAAFLEKVERFL